MSANDPFRTDSGSGEQTDTDETDETGPVQQDGQVPRDGPPPGADVVNRGRGRDVRRARRSQDTQRRRGGGTDDAETATPTPNAPTGRSSSDPGRGSDQLLPSDADIQAAVEGVLSDAPEQFASLAADTARATEAEVAQSSAEIASGTDDTVRETADTVRTGTGQMFDVVGEEIDDATPDASIDNLDEGASIDFEQRAETNRELFVEPLADAGGFVGEKIGEGVSLVNPNIEPGAEGPADIGERTGRGAGAAIGETANLPAFVVDAERAGEFTVDAGEATASGEGGRIVEIGDGEVELLEGGFAEERVEAGIESAVETAQENPFRTVGGVVGGAAVTGGSSALLRSGAISRAARGAKSRVRRGVRNVERDFREGGVDRGQVPGGRGRRRREREDTEREQQEVELEPGEEPDTVDVEDEDVIPGVNIYDEEGNLVSRGAGRTKFEDQPAESIPGVREVRNVERGRDDEPELVDPGKQSDADVTGEANLTEAELRDMLADTEDPEVLDQLADELVEQQGVDRDFFEEVADRPQPLFDSDTTAAALGVGAGGAQDEAAVFGSDDVGDTTTATPTPPAAPDQDEADVFQTRPTIDTATPTPTPPAAPDQDEADVFQTRPTIDTAAAAPQERQTSRVRARDSDEKETDETPSEERILQKLTGTGIAGAESFERFEEQVLQTDDPLGEVLGESESRGIQ